MAGDWIKFEIGTSDKPEVWAIAHALDIDPDAVTGKLLRVWAWFDQHTEEGNAPSVTKMLLDRSVGVPGFCDEVIRAGWMLDTDGILSLPNFDRHNGSTAKNRALTAKRVAKHKAKANGKDNGKVTGEALPREEKRRNPSLRSGKSAGATSIDHLKIPEWIDPGVWMKFVEHRNKTAKTRLTPAAVEILIEKLTKAKGFGHDPNEMIKDAIANGYQGVVFDRHLHPARKGAQTAPQADLEKLWDEAIASFSKFGPGQSVVFSDPRIRPAIEAVFGDYHNFKTCSQRDLDFRKQQFLNAVRAHA